MFGTGKFITNLLLTHRGTDSVRDLGLFCHNTMLRSVGVMACVSCVNRSRNFWTNLALVPHGPVTISSRTAIGTRPGVCRSLV